VRGFLKGPIHAPVCIDLRSACIGPFQFVFYLTNKRVAGLIVFPGNRNGFVVARTGVLHVDKQRDGIETEIDSACFVLLVLTVG